MPVQNVSENQTLMWTFVNVCKTHIDCSIDVAKMIAHISLISITQYCFEGHKKMHPNQTAKTKQMINDGYVVTGFEVLTNLQMIKLE